MASRRAEGWASLEAEDIGELREKEFERFCYDLICFEAYERHDDPDPLGPTAGGKDGGRDILLAVRKKPVVSRGDYQTRYALGPVTWDEFGRTAYSCKTGEGWLDLALGDAKSGGARVIEVLREGGRFVLLLGAIGRLDQKYPRGKGDARVELTPKEHLVAALWGRLKDGDPDAPDPADRVEIFDAHKLATWLRARAPEGGAIASWLDHFKLRPVLSSFEDWSRFHLTERRDLRFVGTAREALLTEVRSFAHTRGDDPSRRVAWLLGPPGVGKTRALLEALREDPSIAQRVRVAYGTQEALDGLRAALDRYADPLVVVDDCSSMEAQVLAHQFRVQAHTRPGCHLVLVTPAALAERGRTDIATRWELKPLDDETAHRVARDATGDTASLSETTVAEIVRLAEGYPWFLALLAREAAQEGRAPESLAEAVDWALASKWEVQGEHALVNLRRLRRRALLAALLTHGLDWNEFNAEQRGGVARAVGLSDWQQVRDAADDCVKRGVLRRRLYFQYVTPQVLAREVAVTTFDPGSGDDPGARRLREHGGEFLERFFQDLSLLGLSPDRARPLGEAVLEGLAARGADFSAWVSTPLLGSPLGFAAEHLPAETAALLRRAAEATAMGALRALVGARRALVRSLGELVSRRASFEDAEAALFRMALAENESYADNASAVWSGVFSPSLHFTHRSAEQRTGLLTLRLNDVAPEARRVALQGLRAMMALEEARGAPRALDGPWPRPSPEERARILQRAWELLLLRLEDEDEAVVDAAVHIVCKELVTATWGGLGDRVLPGLAAHSAALSERHRRALAGVVQQIRSLDEAAAGSAALHELERALAPTSLRERIRLHFGTGGVDLDESAAQQDDALAAEVLGDLAALRAELPWLVSTEAVRAGSFALALGRADAHGVARSEVRALGRQEGERAPAFAARYLAGMVEAGHVALVEGELAALSEDAAGAYLLALVSVLTSATPARLAGIEAAVRRGDLRGQRLYVFGHQARWLAALPDEQVRDFLRVLLACGDVDGAVAVVLIARHLLPRMGSDPCFLRDVVMQALEPAAGAALPGIGYAWAICAMAMIDLGEVEAVVGCAVTALGRPSGALREGWRVLRHACERDAAAAWAAVARRLERDDEVAGHFVLASRFSREGPRWPTEPVLAWVGRDSRRARIAVWLAKFEGGIIPPLLRALVEHFGAESSVAREVMNFVEGTDGPVASLADHARARLEAILGWAEDVHPEVRAFAQAMNRRLSGDLERHEAEEAEERRRWGT